jgi:peptidoglycan/LPS O-acetylase OafA/YrhL
MASSKASGQIYSFRQGEKIKIKYRPEIDGLRTIAVISVILYHAKITVAGVQLLPGGYLGVDIFFVISGHLITTLLMTELAQTGRVSILSFYERRARRLLPALLVVMLASLPFAWRYLLPEQLVSFSKSLVYSLLFASNFYWNFSLQQYGADSALLQPFLHTWSLAVEEQYYIIFPLLLFMIYKWGRQYLAGILSFILVLSLLFAQWMTGRDASFSFYMMPTRFWELLAGSLLALVVLNNSTVNSNSLWQRAMPSLGLLLIIGSLASFGFDVHHPGLITLIPVVGTVLIICFKSEGDWVARALSRPSMVYLGLLSYSLYLWHYPIFAFGRMADPAPSIFHKSAWIVLTLLLSVLSYYLIEKPFRRRKVSRRLLMAVLLFTSSLVIFVSLYWIRGDGIPSRGSYVRDLIQSNSTIVVSQNGKACRSDAGAGEIVEVSDSCIFEYSPGAPTLVLVGDSHANAIAESVRVLARTNELNYVHVTQVACPHISNQRGRCSKRDQALKSFLTTLDSPTIIYSARLPLYIEREPFYNPEAKLETEDEIVRGRKSAHFLYPDHVSEDVVATLNDWVDDGYGLVIVYPVPEQGFHTAMTLSLAFSFASNAEQLPTLSTSYDEYKKRVASSYAALDKVTGSKVRRVYPEKIFCREETGRCIASEYDRLYFPVDNHLGPLGADLVVREVAEQLQLKIPDSFRK